MDAVSLGLKSKPKPAEGGRGAERAETGPVGVGFVGSGERCVAERDPLSPSPLAPPWRLGQVEPLGGLVTPGLMLIAEAGARPSFPGSLGKKAGASVAELCSRYVCASHSFLYPSTELARVGDRGWASRSRWLTGQGWNEQFLSFSFCAELHKGQTKPRVWSIRSWRRRTRDRCRRQGQRKD